MYVQYLLVLITTVKCSFHSASSLYFAGLHRVLAAKEVYFGLSGSVFAFSEALLARSPQLAFRTVHTIDAGASLFSHYFIYYLFIIKSIRPSCIFLHI